MDMLKIEILRLVRKGTPVHRYNSDLRESDYKPDDIDLACRELVANEFARGEILQSIPGETPLCVSGLTDKGEAHLDEQEAELARIEREIDEINRESYRDMY